MDALATHPVEGERGEGHCADAEAHGPVLQGLVAEQVDTRHGGRAVVPRDGLHQRLVPTCMDATARGSQSVTHSLTHLFTHPPTH